ncbi:MAG TPA: TlpA disulfide reductase family protein [Verrucomicrobiae bacterium]|nr:TlpA disulfide reductase family protein [Verrucomicrobiae bacterium]
MKIRLLVVLSALGLLGSSPVAPAQETNTAANELKALVSKIQDKLHEGKKTEADLGPELKEFDTLIEKHKAEKTDDTAQIVLMKAMLYLEVFDDSKKGTALVEDLKRDYPDTKAGKNADGILANIKQEEAAKEIQRTLVAGAKFPDFAEKDLEGKPLSPSNFKGKVVLIDFWATWCRPCVMELPNVQKAYEKHHDKGFEIIGISLDQDQERLKSFIKDKNMTWQQYFDGKGWGNKLAQKYGIQSIPATFLLDGEGKIIGRDLRGEALEPALAKALP